MNLIRGILFVLDLKQMGIYYVTYFYFDIHDLSKKILVANLDPIIDKNDELQGYVSKQELLKFYGDLVTEVGENSYLVEYVYTSFNFPTTDLKETKRLQVK